MTCVLSNFRTFLIYFDAVEILSLQGIKKWNYNAPLFLFFCLKLFFFFFFLLLYVFVCRVCVKIELLRTSYLVISFFDLHRCVHISLALFVFKTLSANRRVTNQDRGVCVCSECYQNTVVTFCRIRCLFVK